MSYENIYFIGIGGIGMSAIARYYKFKGYRVGGYDRTPSELTAALESEGIEVHYEDRPDLIPADVEKTLVVYTPAIPSDLQELVQVKQKGYRLLKRAQVLGELTRMDGQRCLAVSGTHGKTTTSTLLAHIFTASGEGCSAFLGGISKNYDSNLLMSHSPAVVVEADEFDRSFHQLTPEISVITAMDADHLDIYGDLSHVQESFRKFASLTTGTVIAKAGLPVCAADTGARLMSYAYDNPEADFHASRIRVDGCGYFTFDLCHPGGVIGDCRVGVPGWVNVENAVAASAIALCYGLEPMAVKAALATFQGVRRRFDIQLNRPGLAYIDDYAHHPNEISTAISSMRDIFPHHRLTAVFQPHLYTRTRDFAEEFARALSGVDKLILLDIYPAREEPIPGVSSELIFDKVTAPEKVLLRKEELMDYLREEKIDTLITFGAGNIDRYIPEIKSMLEAR
ncbi:MAG: UDP-N-acetylmuramate--L-alanine ligase [Candidatus Cryptobacteroides sp.]